MGRLYDSFIGAKPIAVIGASDNPRNFGAVIYRTLRDKGYGVYAVNPNVSTVAGDPSYDSVETIPAEVSSAIIAVSPKVAESLIESLSTAGVKKIWFQRGADYRKAAAYARDVGMEAFEGRCILMHTDSVNGIHAVHRFLVRLTGNL